MPGEISSPPCPVVMNDVAVLDLPLAGLAAQLADRFRHAGEIAEVIAGEQAAAGVDRDAAAGPDGARFHERAALALLAEAVVLELEQHLGGEAVVELAAVDVVERERRLSERLLLGARHRHVGEILLLPPQVRRHFAEALAEHIDRRLRAVLGAVGRGEDEGDAAVGDEADVEQVIGLGHQRRVLVVLDGHRAAVHLGLGILAGPGALRHRDGAELAAGGAVDRHVARRHPAMMADRAQVAERLAPVAGLLGVGHAAVAGLARFLRLRPVGHRAHDADVFGDAAVEERQRGRDAEPGERAAAADHEIEAVVETEQARIGVDVAGAVAAAAGAAQIDGAVDVLRREPGVHDGEARRFRRHHALGTVRLLARHDAEADDGVLSG